MGTIIYTQTKARVFVIVSHLAAIAGAYLIGKGRLLALPKIIRQSPCRTACIGL
jgi:hypothetical protein